MTGCRVERNHEAFESLQGLRGEVAAEQARGRGTGCGAAALGGAGGRRGVRDRGERRGGVAEDQPGRRAGMAQRELERHEPAGGVTEDDRPLDAQCRARGGDVVGHLLERARLERRRGGAALPAEVDEHELGVAASARRPGRR